MGDGLRDAPPAGAPTSRALHRVAFYETDAMGIVHHSNYVRFFENARVVWLDEHDEPYVRYAERDLHFAVTKVEVEYLRSARFDDRLSITTWMDWARGASLRMAYRIDRIDRIDPVDGAGSGAPDAAPEKLALGATEHAAVDGAGRVRRIPRERRANLQALAAGPPPGGR